jgi:hypothetical protein
VLVFVAACGFHISGGSNLDGSVVDGADDDAGSDADIDGPLVDMMTDSPTDGWSAPQPLGLSDATEPTLTADLLQIWFVRGNDIHHASRANIFSAFSGEGKVMELSTGSTESSPEVASDGRSITFARLVGNNDILTSTFNAMQSWTLPVPFVEVNTGDHETSGGFSDDGLMFAFVRNMPAGTKDIYFMTRATTQSPWTNAAPQTELNSTADDSGAFLSSNKLTVCFDSNRAGGQPDIYCATRASATVPFSTPQPVTEVNSQQADKDPWLSPNGKVMVFWSDRDGTGKLYFSLHP